MNKEIFEQMPADEHTIAVKLNSAAETMKIDQTFQWKLESHLMDTYQNKSQPARGWFSKFVTTTAWVTLAIGGIFLFGWAIRSLSTPDPLTAGASNTEIPFETQIRQGTICAGPLAVAHDFSVAITDPAKTSFIPLDPQKIVGELRSFAWSLDGTIAIVGNTTGSGNIYLSSSNGSPLQPVLVNSELGYLMDVAWSHDGQQLITWSLNNNTIAYRMNSDGSGLTEIQPGLQIFAVPQITPDNKSILFFGADSSSSGLFEYNLAEAERRMFNAHIEDETGFAWEPGGTRLAYVEMDRESGEARLIVEEFNTGQKAILATLPIPKGSGSSIPEAANLSWSQDGTKLVFEFGRTATDRVIYLAYINGGGLTKITDSAYAPTFSSDGKCLAYIKDKQVFLLELPADSSEEILSTPLLLTDLPAGYSIAGFKLDMLRWSP
jgi:WD40 repeat protein